MKGFEDVSDHPNLTFLRCCKLIVSNYIFPSQLLKHPDLIFGIVIDTNATTIQAGWMQKLNGLYIS